MTINGVNEIHQGNAVDKLRGVPDGVFQTCITSPPYWGLRDYKVAGQIGLEKTPEEYVAKIVEVFREVRRTLKDDGTLWLNLGDSYLSKQGWSREGDGGIQYTNRGSVSGNAPRKCPPGYKPKDLVGIPWMVAFALRADGWYLRQDIIWSKPNPMPESVKDRCTKSHEYLFLLSKSSRYYFDYEEIQEPVAESVLNDKRTWDENYTTNRIDRSFPFAHPSKGAGMLKSKPREKPFGDAGGNRHGDEGKLYKLPSGWDMDSGSHGTIHRNGRNSFKRSHSKRGVVCVPGHKTATHRSDRPDVDYSGPYRNKRSVWEIATVPFSAAHFATFPESLVEPCILAGSREGDIVLDPFAVSGTVAKVAGRSNRCWYGIELNPEYIQMAYGTRLKQLRML